MAVGPDDRPKALLVTPVVPTTAGPGLAMRAALWLDALSLNHDVEVAAVAPSNPNARIRSARLSAPTVRVYHSTSSAADWATAWLGHPDWRRLLAAVAPVGRAITLTGPGLAAEIADDAGPLDVLVIFRLYLAPLVRPFVDRGGHTVRVLDLDDDDGAPRRGSEPQPPGPALGFDQGLADRLAGAAVGWFDLATLASADDLEPFDRRHPGRVPLAHVPNAVSLPADAHGPAVRATGASARLLFVGNLAYAPNIVAAQALCDEILPALRERGHRHVVVTLAGRNPGPDVTRLESDPAVTVHADVADLAPLYREADVVVAPLRAGSGTSIKVLEAFAHGCPVVTTSVGARGLAVEPGRHLLTAESPAGLAEAVEQVVITPSLAARLAAEGRELVERDHDYDHVIGRIDTLVADVGRRAQA